MDFLSIENIAFTVIGYDLSDIELIGTVFGLLAVYWASRENIWTWPASVINVAAFFVLFYQVNLYSDMFLQVYFLIVTVFGWYNWSKPSEEIPITKMSEEEILIMVISLIIGTVTIGYFMSGIHETFPTAFPEPAAYPYPDAFTTTASIIAMILLSQKKIENWLLWIAVDVIAVILYMWKGIIFVSVEYAIFLVICIFGYINWKKKMDAS